MQKTLALSLALLLSLPACCKRKSCSGDVCPADEIALLDIEQEPMIPLANPQQPEEFAANDTVRSFFDEDSADGFVRSEEDQFAQATIDDADFALESDDFAWDDDAQEQADFKTVYFNFDEHSVRKDQLELVEQDIARAQEVLAQARSQGVNPTIVVEGHSCHSAGSAVYNLALSEKRAKAVADWFVKAGIPRENIKLVGRGHEMPALIDGKQVEGSREEQWPNRRTEVRVIYS